MQKHSTGAPKGRQTWMGKVNGVMVRFVKCFRHWRSGKIIRAEDYGKKAFIIPLHRNH